MFNHKHTVIWFIDWFLKTTYVWPGDIHDEWTLAENVKQPNYRARMARHWDEWISKWPFSFRIIEHAQNFNDCFFLRFREELETLSNSGINYVRIPVGYWTWQVEPEEPFPAPILDDSDSSGALFYLKRLLVWLDQLGMKANIDLHGAPGSQNGFEIRQKAKLPLDILGLITVGELARRTGWKKVRWIGPRRCWGWSAQRWDSLHLHLWVPLLQGERLGGGGSDRREHNLHLVRSQRAGWLASGSLPDWSKINCEHNLLANILTESFSPRVYWLFTNQPSSVPRARYGKRVRTTTTLPVTT